MNNPIITHTLESFNIPEVVDIYKVILEYNSGDPSMKCTLYDENVSEIEEDPFSFIDVPHPVDYVYNVDMNVACSLIKRLCRVELSQGTDKKSIYNKQHQQVEYIRFVIPDGLLQIDYEDELTALDVVDEMGDYMRGLLKEI